MQRQPVREGRTGQPQPERGAGPLLLAVETSTRVMSVALCRGEALVGEITTHDSRVHSERLLPAIDQLLAQAGIGLDAIEAFAVSSGPGSFTGLRIGLATVKAFALAGDRPVVAVPSLLALTGVARAAPGPVAALLDARRGEVYAAAASRPGGPKADELAESVYRPEELARRLPEGATLVLGEGSGFVAEALAARQDLACLEGAEAEPRASAVARWAAEALARGETVAVEDLLPRYLRRAEAEARRTGEALEPLPAPGKAL